MLEYEILYILFIIGVIACIEYRYPEYTTRLLTYIDNTFIDEQ